MMPHPQVVWFGNNNDNLVGGGKSGCGFSGNLGVGVALVVTCGKGGVGVALVVTCGKGGVGVATVTWWCPVQV